MSAPTAYPTRRELRERRQAATRPRPTEADLHSWELNLREREIALREARFAHNRAKQESEQLWAKIAALPDPTAVR